MYVNGDIFEGMWVDGVKKGNGVIRYNNKDRYEGNFDSDLPNGIGKYYFSNGDIYEGPFKNGFQHGFGKYYTAFDGFTQEYVWEEGKRKTLSFINESAAQRRRKSIKSPII